VVEERGGVDTEPLVGCVPLQPPEAVHVCAPLALQVKVIVWPELTLVELDSNEIDGFTLVVAAEAAAPLPSGATMLSPSQAAIAEKIAHAKTHAKARMTRAGVLRAQLVLAGVRKAALRTNRWLRPSEVIRVSLAENSPAAATSFARAICHNDHATVITSGERNSYVICKCCQYVADSAHHRFATDKCGRDEVHRPTRCLHGDSAQKLRDKRVRSD
jgi:hypothetical protein